VQPFLDFPLADLIVATVELAVVHKLAHNYVLEATYVQQQRVQVCTLVGA
jgi:hypothetical protein